MNHMKSQISALNDPFPSLDGLLGNWFGVGGSWLKYLLLIPLMLLTILFVFCLFHKIIVSCVAKCMTEPPTKIMTTRLEAADQTHSSVFDQRSYKSRYGKMQQKGILSWAITRRQVSRDLWLLRPSPVIAHCFRTKTFKTGNEPSQQRRTKWSWNAPQSMDVWRQGGCVNYKLALTKSITSNWTTKAIAICLYGDWTPCCCSCWPATPPEEVQGGVRHSALQGIWWDRVFR